MVSAADSVTGVCFTYAAPAARAATMSSREIGDAPIANYRTRVRAVLIANGNDADGGVVVERFSELGWSFEAWAREDAPAWPALPADVGLVVSLGSDWSVYWEDVAPSVAAEAALLGVARRADVPVLGICFGGQMLSHALGGRVERAAEPEIGWFSVDFGPEMAEFGDLSWFQWHYDRFTVPSGAEELAVGAQGPQAFRLGRLVGLQFHPEVTPAIVERWSSGPGADELERVGLDRAALLADTTARATCSREAGRALVDWFVAHVVNS